MNSQKSTNQNREIKYSHLIQAALPITFAVVWFLDSSFSLSVWLNSFVPLIVRIILFSIVLALALILMRLSHGTLFHDNEASNSLITEGILSKVRNPLYLGILLIYVSCILLSISLICIALFIIIALIYNKMVNYEESVLAELFGEEYLEYKKKVPKWIPKLF